MNPSLLVIDDSPDIHALLEVRLRPEGLRVHHADSGEEGVNMAKAILPDVILLDVDMPEVSGFDVCRRLKADPTTSGIPVIFLTGAADVGTKVHGFDLGAVDYVTKPFEPAELRARVRAALRTKRYQDMLETRASIDGLTGLSTRRCFDERLGAEVHLANVERRALSLVLLDVDHFKRLNDDHGHPFGDRVLQALGELLNGERRDTETAHRYGGEEFALLMPGASPTVAAARAAVVLDRLRELAFPVGRDVVRVTASLGVATGHGGERISAAGLVSSADRALYAAKTAGRNRVVVWSATSGRGATVPPPA